ncbi:MAG: kelch repeat-containing protein [Bacteroidota bacterium]
MQRISLIVIGFSLVLWASCQKAAINPSSTPFVITKEVTEITDSTVTFYAELFNSNNTSTLEYGFVWDFTDPTLSSPYKVTLAPTPNAGDFSATVDYGLFKDRNQIVRAFVISDDYSVLGNQQSFVSNGVGSIRIESFEPTSAYVNSQVKITVSDTLNSSAVKVIIADKEAGIDSIVANELYVRVPDVNNDTETSIVIDLNGKLAETEEKLNVYTYWREIGRFPGNERYGAVSFTIGNKGYVATGKNREGDSFNDLWEFDPKESSWTQKENFPGMARAFAVGFSINGKGYVGFGYGENGPYLNDLWEYEPASNTWAEKLSNRDILTFGNAHFVIDGKLHLYSIRNAFIYDPDLNQYSPATPFQDDERTLTTGLSMNGNGYIIAGQELVGNRLKNDFWQYRKESDTWIELQEIPGGARDGIAAFPLNNKIFAGLGGIWGGRDVDFYQFDPTLNAWSRIQDFKGDKRELPVSFVIEGKGYIGLGRKTRNEPLKDFWEFDPSKE